MSERILIKFTSKGDKRLYNSILRLAAAQATLTGDSKKLDAAISKLTASQKKLGRRNRLLDNTFATLRSKMLLFSFAMSLGGRQLIAFGKKAAQVESMSRAFAMLSGGTEAATTAIDKLREATNNTMSDFDLFQQANNAMILGVSKNSDEMAEMFDVAQRLGRALGRDTRSSVESLITGIGRQSRLMLDNIGIIVKSSDAYEKFAANIGKTAESLTDAEKKQAFLNAALDAGRSTIALFGDEVTNNQDTFDKFSASMDNLSVRVGNVVNDGMEPLLKAISDLADSVTEEGLESFMEFLSKGISDNFTKTLLQFMAVSSKANRQEREQDKHEVDAAARRVAKIQALKTINKEELQRNIINLEFTETVDRQGKKARELTDIERELLRVSKEYFQVLGDSSLTYEEFIAIEDKLNKSFTETNISRERNLNNILKEMDLLPSYMKQTEEYQAVLQNLNSQLTNLDPTFKATNSQVNALASAFTSAAMAGDHLGRSVEKAMKQIIATFAANQIVFSVLTNIFGFGGLQAPTLFGKTLKNLFGHQGGQVQGYATGGIIPPLGMPSYQSGGSVDNVPAMLQEGEYVMRRSAVQSIGIENLNRMNRTGQSGGVNISFTGNVLSDDFITNEAIPKIKTAIRRGADLGIS
tara:strand:- start:2151 stop:4070 length:1920 start_codon:yes stop_codon:yes gene_type:complete